jgi:hypothetical protein
MFNWGLSLYNATRAAAFGGLAFLLLLILFAFAGGDIKGDGRAADFLAACLLIGFIRLGWDALTKKYPNA